ncbi:MAG: GWxTD domain-containing protein [Bacteroidetes bacterium]|nr:GWxTD domain-containing protein [Bacteroidota bacterium]
MKFLISLVLGFSPILGFAQSNTAQLFIVQDSWSDSTIQHSIYGYLTQTQSEQDTADLEFFSSGQLVDKKILTIQDIDYSLINYKSVQPRNVHIDSCKFTFRTGRIIKYQVSQYLIRRTEKVVFSPLVPFLQKRKSGESLFKIPANTFSPDSDSLTFSIATQFFPGNKQSRLGYQFYLRSSNQDTLVKFYKRIPDSTQRLNTVTLALNKIPSGKYELIVDLLINNSIEGKINGGPVYILSGKSNEGVTQRNVDQAESGTFFNDYTENELDEFLEKSRFIASNEELKLYGNLSSINQKQKFLNSFWIKRQNDQENNLFRYLEKLSIVEDKFGQKGKKGFKTDRGRVYLRYGQCDDVFVSNSTQSVKPFEVWFYPTLNGQTSVYFYFIDQKGYGDLQLIHSTARDEVYNPTLLERLGIEATNYRN